MYPVRKVVTIERFLKNCLMMESYRDVLRKDPCPYCGWRPPKKKHRTLDHIKPESKGGTGGWENTTLSCLFCNRLKGSMELLDFLIVHREKLEARRQQFHAVCIAWLRTESTPTVATTAEGASSANTSNEDTANGSAATAA